MSKPQIKMVYFDMKGRAEPTRLALAIGGIDFEDERISRESFHAAKTSGAYPFGQLPVLVVNGRMVAQSQAMLRYAGQLSGLYPSDPYEALLVDEMVGAVEDVITATVPALREQDEAKRIKIRQELASSTYPTWFGMIEKKLDDTGYCANGKLSIADLVAYSTFTWLASGLMDHIPTTILDGFPKIQAVLATVAAHPKVAAWNEAHGQK